MAQDSAALEGTTGAPTSVSSDNSGGQPNSTPEFVTVEQFRELQESITSLSRNLQSQKDRAVKRTEERLESIEGDLKAVLSGALKRGETIQDVLAQVEKKEQEDLQASLLEMARTWKTGQIPLAGTKQDNAADVSQVLKELELDLSDPRVKEFASKRFVSDAEAYREAAKLQKNLYTKQPTEADKPGPESRRSESLAGQAALKAEYAEGSKNLRGQALVNYKMQMRKKGLAID